MGTNLVSIVLVLLFVLRVLPIDFVPTFAVPQFQGLADTFHRKVAGSYFASVAVAKIVASLPHLFVVGLHEVY